LKSFNPAIALGFRYSYLIASIPFRLTHEDLRPSHYLYRTASTGFLVAARQLCQLFFTPGSPEGDFFVSPIGVLNIFDLLFLLLS
jgi:hypothetical protein